MALKISNKNRKKEKVMFPDPFKSSEFKEDVVEEILEPVIINYLVTEEDIELYKILERRRDDDISIVIFWISIIVVSVIGLML